MLAANKRASKRQAEAGNAVQIEREQAHVEEEQEALERQRAEQAVTRIAATQRGRQARARVRSIHKKLDDLENFIGVADVDADANADEDSAEVEIGVRRARQNSSFDQPKLGLEAPPCDWALAALDNITDLIDAEDSAAAKIQAVHRGRQVRAQLNLS